MRDIIFFKILRRGKIISNEKDSRFCFMNGKSWKVTTSWAEAVLGYIFREGLSPLAGGLAEPFSGLPHLSLVSTFHQTLTCLQEAVAWTKSTSEYNCLSRWDELDCGYPRGLQLIYEVGGCLLQACEDFTDKMSIWEHFFFSQRPWR